MLRPKDSFPDVFPPERGYDEVSDSYDDTIWATFWRMNEAPYVKDWLENLAPGLGLDAGSGTGPYLNNILKAGHRCVAYDISSKMLKISKLKNCNAHDRIEFIAGRIENLLFNTSKFDWVLCTRVLSHSEDIETVLKEFSRVLKRGGKLFISDIHSNHPYSHTSFKTPKGKVRIETHKHSIFYVKYILNKLNFKFEFSKEFKIHDLVTSPNRQDFEKLYLNEDKEIFYVIEVSK